MALCTGITVGSVNANCSADGNGLITGAAETIMIYNWNEIDPSTAFAYDVTDTNKVTAITNPSGVQAYDFIGFRRSNKPSYELVPSAVSVGYSHTIDFTILESTYAQKENLLGMASGRLLVVVENLDRSGDNSFEIYGTKVGLVAITLSRTVDDIETGAGFVLQLSTAEEDSKEPLMPLTWDAGGYDSTKALFDALTTPGV
jgi:hypothetical protein